MSKRTQSFWLSSCPDVFGGYGLMATGATRKAAENALWAAYEKSSPEWNGWEKPFHKTFKSLGDWHGVHTRKLEIGKAYLGDNEVARE